MKVYNKIASVYDYMINWEERLQTEDPFFHHLFREQMTKSIVDLGCGSGGHALHWGEMGYNVTGIDSSKDMIALAKKKAESLEIDIEFVCSPILDFPSKIEEPVDMVVCLGNTLPHILETQTMEKLFRDTVLKLNPMGIAVVHLLNYERILETQRRDFPVKSCFMDESEYVFIRFYDYHQQNLLFNLVSISKEKDTWNSTSISMYHYPWRLEELKEIARNAGFKTVMEYGDFGFAEFVPEQSENLILVCEFNEEPA